MKRFIRNPPVLFLNAGYWDKGLHSAPKKKRLRSRQFPYHAYGRNHCALPEAGIAVKDITALRSFQIKFIIQGFPEKREILTVKSGNRASSR
jgi:hypothetical protein